MTVVSSPLVLPGQGLFLMQHSPGTFAMRSSTSSTVFGGIFSGISWRLVLGKRSFLISFVIVSMRPVDGSSMGSRSSWSPTSFSGSFLVPKITLEAGMEDLVSSWEPLIFVVRRQDTLCVFCIDVCEMFRNMEALM